MKENPSMHERLAERLACILTKLNMGMKLSVKDLALEFSVSTRTVSRDFDRMSGHLPLLQDEKTKKFYLDPAYLTKIKAQETPQLSGMSHFYTSADIPFLHNMLDQQTAQFYGLKGFAYERAEQYEALFQAVGSAIQQCQQIAFLFKGELQLAQPYRLIQLQGCWYLAAVCEGNLKSYPLSHIVLQQKTEAGAVFEPDPMILAQLQTGDYDWLYQDTFEVEIKVSAELAAYFKQSSVLPKQSIKAELNDGCLLLTSEVGHAMQILPLVQFWMPALSIVQPESLRQELKGNLERCLQQMS
ncbi:helix-turn-helix transcriptional regulator [Acinetobacter tianfuensis]|uniref:WYL domain-containing protein n=1 Tax=Acinetobacter tianfuensis TaxID=2419603 RepID=A0A3A8EWM0_9GAMM|nr:WYL domain-containing protein [Acinetobacter tianfuensis]RKG32823.1 WYL domain-containing protein [Acinetobacter tianfuensis]